MEIMHKRIHWERRSGVLLHTIPYLGAHRILKIMTLDAGLLSVIVKHAHSKKASWTTPFCAAEWIIKHTQGDLHALKDATLLDPLIFLKENYERVQAAGMIANDLLRTQLPHKATPKLYELLLAYFKHLPLNPSALAQSFRLKLLQHEGLILLSARCTHCNEPASHLSEGESVCLRHSSTYRHSFEEHEWKLLLALSSIKRFSELKTTKISSAFEQKTENLLKERIR